MKRALVFCFLLLAFGIVPNTSAADPVSLDEYRRAVAQTIVLVQQALALAPDARADLLNQAAAQLEPIDSVQLPSGAASTVNNAALIALIRDPRQTANAATRLTALRDALAQPLPPVSANDLAQLDSIFSRPPFVDPNSTLPAL